MLDAHADEHNFIYSAAHNFGSGFHLYIHEPRSSVSVHNKIVALAPGHEHHIVLEHEKNIRLNPPYSVKECRENERKGDTDYGTCLIDCSRNMLYSNCTCAQNDIYSCTYLEISRCYLSNLVPDLSKHCQHCIVNCKTNDYNIMVSSLAFPVATSYDDIKGYTNLNRNYSEAKDNVMIVKIYFNSLDYKVIEQHKSFEVTTLLANIGGLVGLSVGASIITLLEILEIIWVYIHGKCMLYIESRNNNKIIDLCDHKQ